METVIRKLIEDKINQKQYKMSLGKVEAFSEELYIVEIHGGMNGFGRWSNYLTEIKDIVDLFDRVYLSDLNTDSMDDVYAFTLMIFV